MDPHPRKRGGAKPGDSIEDEEMTTTSALSDDIPEVLVSSYPASPPSRIDSSSSFLGIDIYDQSSLNRLSTKRLRTLAKHSAAEGRLETSIHLYETVLTRTDWLGDVHLVDTLEGHKDAVQAVVQLSNRQIASGSIDGTIRVWDLCRLSQRAKIPLHLDNGVWTMTNSESKDAASSSDGGSESGANSLGSNASTSSTRPKTKRRDTATKLSPVHHSSTASQASSSSAGSSIAPASSSSSSSSSAKSHAMESDRCVCSDTLEEHQGSIWALEVIERGKVFASASSDKSVKIWSYEWEDPDEGKDDGEAKSPKTKLRASKTKSKLRESKEDKEQKSVEAKEKKKSKTKVKDKSKQEKHSGEKGEAKPEKSLRKSQQKKKISAPDLTAKDEDKLRPRGMPAKSASVATGANVVHHHHHSESDTSLEGTAGHHPAHKSHQQQLTSLSSVAGGSASLLPGRKWKCVRTLNGHGGFVLGLKALSKSRLASCSRDKTIKIWDLESGACLRNLVGHTNSVWTIEFLPAGFLLSGSYDSTVKAWRLSAADVNGDQSTKRLSNETARKAFLSVAADDSEHSSGSKEPTETQCVLTLEGHTNYIFALETMPDNKVASGSWGPINVPGLRHQPSKAETGSICVWDLSSLVKEPAIPDEKPRSPRSHYKDDEKHHKSKDKDSEKSKHYCKAALYGHADWIHSLRDLDYAPQLASGSMDGTVKIWDTDEEKCLRTIAAHSDAVLSIDVLSVVEEERLFGLTAPIKKTEAPGDDMKKVEQQARRGSIAITRKEKPVSYLMTSSSDKTIKIWSFESRDKKAKVMRDLLPLYRAVRKFDAVVAACIKVTDYHLNKDEPSKADKLLSMYKDIDDIDLWRRIVLVKKKLLKKREAELGVDKAADHHSSRAAASPAGNEPVSIYPTSKLLSLEGGAEVVEMRLEVARMMSRLAKMLEGLSTTAPDRQQEKQLITEAFYLWKEAYQLDNKQINALLGLKRIMEKKGNSVQASALAFRLGKLYEKRNNVHESKVMYEDAVRLNDENKEAYSGLIKMMACDYEEIRKQVTQLVSQNLELRIRVKALERQLESNAPSDAGKRVKISLPVSPADDASIQRDSGRLTRAEAGEVEVTRSPARTRLSLQGGEEKTDDLLLSPKLGQSPARKGAGHKRSLSHGGRDSEPTETTSTAKVEGNVQGKGKGQKNFADLHLTDAFDDDDERRHDKPKKDSNQKVSTRPKATDA